MYIYISLSLSLLWISPVQDYFFKGWNTEESNDAALPPPRVEAMACSPVMGKSVVHRNPLTLGSAKTCQNYRKRLWPTGYHAKPFFWPSAKMPNPIFGAPKDSKGLDPAESFSENKQTTLNGSNTHHLTKPAQKPKLFCRQAKTNIQYLNLRYQKRRPQRLHWRQGSLG